MRSDTLGTAVRDAGLACGLWPAGTDIKPIVPALEKIWADSKGQASARPQPAPTRSPQAAACVRASTRAPSCRDAGARSGAAHHLIAQSLPQSSLHHVMNPSQSLADFNFRTVTSKFNELVYQYPIRIPERYSLVIRSLLTQVGRPASSPGAGLQLWLCLFSRPG
jgi:hypothetical protein